MQPSDSRRTGGHAPRTDPLPERYKPASSNSAAHLQP